MVFNRKPESKVTSMPVTEQRAEPFRPQPQMTNQISAAADAESVIGNDLSIEGQSITIRCKGSLRVNGNIQADLHSRRLVVGEEAMINGSIAADDVSVFGRVNGAIYGANVKLHASAEVEGDIHSQHLVIDSGASFDGRSRKVKDASEIAPQLESGDVRARHAAPAGNTGAQSDGARPSTTAFTPPPSRIYA